ncbi:MAG: dihydrodipicolinate synthase family protein [Armatimonadetes bacterium]|nr:dihydrodipicolinate synthase family protein [Armatimonadota bacterium]
MIQPGTYPAAVTPLDEKGRIDWAGVAKLLAWFESSGCTGAVLAGTNGEGPSLSATEKRDLMERAMPMRGKLDLILGIATPSVEEAKWLCRRAADAGAVGALVMPPFYFREASEMGVRDWFLELLDASPLPVIVYNFPKRAGMAISHGLMAELARHERMAGAKDSSGERENLAGYHTAMTREDQRLFVGDETLLYEALETGWSGTISGASNVLALPISALVQDYLAGRKESAEAKFTLVLPLIEAIRKSLQPASHKAILNTWGVLPTARVRRPLVEADSARTDELRKLIEEHTGLPMGV